MSKKSSLDYERINKEISLISKKKKYNELTDYVARMAHSENGIAFIRYYHEFLVPYGGQGINVRVKDIGLIKALKIKHGLDRFKYTILHEDGIKQEHYLKL